jgi:hypothetical protein
MHLCIPCHGRPSERINHRVLNVAYEYMDGIYYPFEEMGLNPR